MDFEIGLLPNALGLFGVACNVGWPFLRGRSAMLWGQTVGCVAFALHYLLLGAHTGSLMAALAGLQAVLAIPLGRDPRFRVIYLATLPVIAAAMVLSWMGIASAFVAVAMGVTSVGRYQTNEVPFRAMMLACIPFWSAHNVIVGSIPGLLSDALSFAAGAWMLWVTVRRLRAVEPSLP